MSASELRQTTMTAFGEALKKLSSSTTEQDITWKCLQAMGFALDAGGSEDDRMALKGFPVGNPCPPPTHFSDGVNEEDFDVGEMEEPDDEMGAHVNFNAAAELYQEFGEGLNVDDVESIRPSERRRRRREIDASVPHDVREQAERFLEAMESSDAFVAGRHDEAQYMIPSVRLRSKFPGVNWEEKIHQLLVLGGRLRKHPVAEAVEQAAPEFLASKMTEDEMDEWLKRVLDLSVDVLRRMKKKEKVKLVWSWKSRARLHYSFTDPMAQLGDYLYNRTKKELEEICVGKSVHYRSAWVKEKILNAVMYFANNTNNPLQLMNDFQESDNRLWHEEL